MKTVPVLLILCHVCAGNSPIWITSEFPSQTGDRRSANSPHKHDKGPVMRPVSKRLSKQSWGWIFETPSHPLWRHCNVSGFSVTYGGSKVTGTIYFCNWGTPVNKRISHIFIGGPHMIISARAPYKYLEGEAPRILGLTRTIHFRNWGIPINMEFPI